MQLAWSREDAETDKRADYGTMAMRYLAEHAEEETTHSARDIADVYNIPLPFCQKPYGYSPKLSWRYRTPASSRQRKINTFDVICARDSLLIITNCITVQLLQKLAGLRIEDQGVVFVRLWFETGCHIEEDTWLIVVPSERQNMFVGIKLLAGGNKIIDIGDGRIPGSNAGIT